MSHSVDAAADISAAKVARHTPVAGTVPSVLYIGVADGTSLDRANALKRVGYRVEHVDLRELLPKSPWVWRITWRLGGHLLSPLVLRALPRRLGQGRFDVCLVDSGEWITPRVIRLLRKHAARVANYNIDDPFGMRDFARSKAYRKSVSSYDLCVVVRADNVGEAFAMGAQDVLRVFRSADEVTHAPRIPTAEDTLRLQSDVLFLGTWFPERGPFLARLVELGVPLTIRGANWNKAPEWAILKPHWRGGSVQGDEYALTIQCAKINLGLLSKGNRDLHTTRSLEIPALGGLLCAERTSEHLEMYVEGKEALFWADAEECAAVCLRMLNDEPKRREIAAAGHLRLLRDGHRNQVVMRTIVERAMAGR